MPVQTNIVIFELNNTISQESFMKQLNEKNIYIVSMGGGKLRMTTHLDFSDDDLEVVLSVLGKL